MLVRINAVPIRNVSMVEALELIDAAVVARDRRCVFFVNADCLNVSARDTRYHHVLGREDALVFADGIGVKLAGHLSRQQVRDNVNGTDMFPLLCSLAAERGRSIFLLGARPGVADEVKQRMTALNPGLKVAGTHHGYFDKRESAPVVEQINRSGADILLVAFGAPAQERWIAEHRHQLQVPVAMGVGGLFDFYSGRIPRAPKVVRDMYLEWAWRLAMEPRRMWRRYLVGNFTFMGRVLWWELNGRNALR